MNGREHTEHREQEELILIRRGSPITNFAAETWAFISYAADFAGCI